MIWCASRWRVWFHNPEEAPYVPTEVPARVLLTFGDEDGLHSRNVSWMCDTVLREAWVELENQETQGVQHVGARGEVFESRSGKAAYYVARLRDLEAGHTYRYRVWTGENAGDWHEFHVPAPQERETSFLYMGDIHPSGRRTVR